MASTMRISWRRPLTQLHSWSFLPHQSIERSYHSYDHPAPPGPFNPIETSILSASIPHVPSHGFSETSLALGAKDAGYLDVSTNLFPRGAFSLIHYHLVTQRLTLAHHRQQLFQQHHSKPLGMGKKVKSLTWERLMGNKSLIHRWQEVRRS